MRISDERIDDIIQMNGVGVSYEDRLNFALDLKLARSENRKLREENERLRAQVFGKVAEE